MKVFTAQQMRDFDRAAVEKYGIPSIVLMENAALRVVEFLEAKFAPLDYKKIVVLCGKGNNGGDGLAIARHLMNLRLEVVVFLAGEKTDYSGDALTNLLALENTYCEVVYAENNFEFQSKLDFAIEKSRGRIVIDALCGTGFSGEVRSDSLKRLLGAAAWSGCVSVDLPSSLNSDTGEAQKETPYATYTLTFAGPKRGMFLRDGLQHCREIWVGDIGTLPEQMRESTTGVELINLKTAKYLLHHRSIDAHKGDAGRVLVIGGSFGMSGAIALAAKSALAIGAGLVTAALPEKILPTFASSILEATSIPLPCDDKGRLVARAADELGELWRNVQVVALGPGLGRSDEVFEFTRRVVRQCPQPLVVDADALHALSSIAESVKNRTAPTILTPHPGEMGELMGISAHEVNENSFKIVALCAQKYGAWVVLKGARSLICSPEGDIWVNLTGNPGMATGGSGDVLTGTIAGLLAQIKHAENATQLGVYLHGYAGDMASRTLGNGLVAGDIATHLPLAMKEIETREVEQINGRLRKLE